MILQYKRHFSILALALCLAALVGCASSADQPGGQTNGQTTAATGGQTGGQSNGQTSVKAPPRVEIKSGDKVNVAECDEYLAKYEACAKAKVPEPGRGAMLSSINQLRQSWITIAVNPETRTNLAAECKQTSERSKQDLKAYACAW